MQGLPVALAAAAALLGCSHVAGAVNVEDWFLTADEINAFSCDVNRSDPPGNNPGLQAWTAGNKVTFIPDGRTFFELIKQEVDNSGSGDAIYGSGWTFGADLDMVPNASEFQHGYLYDCLDGGIADTACDIFDIDAASCALTILGSEYGALTGADASHECCSRSASAMQTCTSVAAVFSRANERGASIKLMVWANQLPEINGGAYLQYGQERMNMLFQQVPNSKSIMVLDERTYDASLTTQLPGTPRSVHTKYYAFLNSDGSVRSAYVGGLDLGACRHDTSDASRRLSIQQTCTGWLDQAIKVEGPATADVANSFVQQYNWKADLGHTQSKGDATKFDNLWSETLPAASPDAPGAGSQYVQVLRTFACDAGQPFVKGADGCIGEYTILHALIKAIKAAQHFVFVEDQYGFSMEIIRSELEAAISRGVKVIAVLNEVGAEVGSAFCGDNVQEMWADLRDQGAYVYQYHRVGSHTDYIHSKTWVIDDCWFMTGSANLNWRSMTLDPEMNVAVMETTCDAWVKSARCEMWSELTPDQTATSICAMPASTAAEVGAIVDSIWGADGAGSSKLVPMVLGTHDSGFWTRWVQWICDFSDPDGRCDDVASGGSRSELAWLSTAVPAAAWWLHLVL